jgi:NDP-sugar pyrophosphorylase family protein
LPPEQLLGRIDRRAILAGHRIVVAKGALVEPGVFLEGPAFVGEDAKLLSGAVLRAGCYVGEGVVVGSHCVLERSILLPGARLAGLNAVTRTVLGKRSTVGTGSILGAAPENVPPGEALVATKGEAGQPGLNSATLLGDAVQLGCNVVVALGAIVSSKSRIQSGVLVPPGIFEGAISPKEA